MMPNKQNNVLVTAARAQNILHTDYVYNFKIKIHIHLNSYFAPQLRFYIYCILYVHATSGEIHHCQYLGNRFQYSFNDVLADTRFYNSVSDEMSILSEMMNLVKCEILVQGHEITLEAI